MTEEQFIQKGKRRGRDFWFLLIRWLALIGWMILIVALILIDRAKPQTKEFMAQAMHLKANEDWNSPMLQWVFYSMLVGLIISLIGLWVNSTRLKRKGDQYSRWLITLAVFSFLGSVFFVVRMAIAG